MPLFRPKTPKIDMDQFIRNVTKWGASLGLASLVAGGVGAGLSRGADVVEDKLTKRKNKERILEASPELTKIPKKRFDLLYGTVRHMGGHDLAGDPLFASEAIKRMHDMPESVVGLVPEMMKAKAEKIRGMSSPGSLSAALRTMPTSGRVVEGLEPINVP